ncbi:MAG: CehA/McbA family metallohydrolase [SAR202 cluster bacterium]|jgi:hypothetical protein|nr:CehA/McbA family metallohydrolase [SAR202 cluster bacterium]
MNDYEPLDLAQWHNAGLEVLGEGAVADTGALQLRGLPFQVGAEGSSECFISLDGSTGPVRITVDQPANRVIFAHRLLKTAIPEGGSIGDPVADYVFRLSGGREVRVPMRERFEISALPAGGSGFGTAGLPFVAVSDMNSDLYPRDNGPWGQAGNRQVESLQGIVRSYCLWSWENPEPETRIESIEIVPAGPGFIIAGITLGRVDEHPFARQGRREARITLTDPDDAANPFDLDLQVDRGDATYVFPLPAADEAGFIDDYHKGFGEQTNAASSPSYAEISATPSATVSVAQGGEEVGAVNWGELEREGKAETPRMSVELLDRGRNWVNVTVLDDETGKPVPSRVHFRSPEGIPYQPHGHHNQVNSNLGTWHVDVGGDVRLGQITYAYIDGTCQGWLPRGDVIVDVARGFEYEPLRTKVRIEPGQQELTLRLKRWIDMNERRWFSGDSHVHFLSTQGAHIESRGEDLNVVNLLQSQWGSLFTNTEEFTGAASVQQQGNNIVYVSQENRQHFMGHMILWGLKSPVMPWCSDGPSEGEIGGHMETTLAHWADAAHAQGGYVISPHFPNPNGEPAALIATGRLDGVEMLRQQETNHLEYYRYLNGGYRLPLVGGTDKMSAEVPVGLYRTYAHIPEDEEFNYDNWCKAVRAGRTFLSGGPIIHLSVEGQGIGDTVGMSGPGTVEVEAWAESIFPIYSLEIVQGGRVVASTQNPAGSRRLEIKTTLPVDGNTWMSARCGALNYFDIIPHHDVWNRGVFAHTSPVYVACGGDWEMYDRDVAEYMRTMVEGDLSYIRESAGVRPPGSVTHHHGEADHQAYLERPFHEALAAIEARMEKH